MNKTTTMLAILFSAISIESYSADMNFEPNEWQMDMNSFVCTSLNVIAESSKVPEH